MRKLTTEERRRRRFTESFHKEHVALIESGEITVAEVCRLYQVKRASVNRWLNKYGSQKLPEPIIVGIGKDYDQFKVLERENKELKQLIGEQQLKMSWMEGLVALAKERLGMDFEKK